MKLADRVDELLAYAMVRGDDGFTNEQAMSYLGCALDQFNRAVRTLRARSTGDVTLVCTPQAQGDLWQYRLVGSYAEAETWIKNRQRDSLTRVRTMESVALVMVNATDGRSVEGRVARLEHSTYRHLRESIDLIMVGADA